MLDHEWVARKICIWCQIGSNGQLAGDPCPRQHYQLEAQLEAARALHVPARIGDEIYACASGCNSDDDGYGPWPCPTAVALGVTG